jgi:hypothetical protein
MNIVPDVIPVRISPRINLGRLLPMDFQSHFRGDIL